MAKDFYIPRYSDDTALETGVGGKQSSGGFFIPSYSNYTFVDPKKKEEDEIKKRREEEKRRKEEDTRKAQEGINNTLKGVGDVVGGVAGAVAEGIAAPFKRVGEGTAEVINELSGGAERERQVQERAQQDSIAIIKDLGAKMRNAKTNEERERYRQAIRRVVNIDDEQLKQFQQRQQEVIERTDPIKGAAATAELGLNVLTGGTVSSAIKGGAAATRAASTAQKLITPTTIRQGAASGAAQGSLYGLTGTAQAQGGEADIADYAVGAGTGAAVGGVVGAAVPAVAQVVQRSRQRNLLKPDEKINDSAIKKVNSAVGSKIEQLAEPVLQSDAGLRTRKFFQDTKQKFIRSEEPILRYLRRGEKEGLLDQDASRRVETLMRDVKTAEQQAEYYMRDNQNWTNVINGLDNKGLEGMAKYAQARAELDLIGRGAKKDAGRSAEYQKVLDSAPEDFSARYDSMVNYYSDLRERLVDSGIVSREQADKWAKQDPSYVHIQRELDNVSERPTSGKGGSGSFATTKAEQKRGESIAETKDLLQVAIGRTQQLEREILRNKAANELVDNLSQITDLNPNLLQKIEGDQKVGSRPTISRRVNGQKETYETLPEIEAAAKSWDQVPLGAVGRAIAFPTRVLRSTLTGPLNPAFLLKSAVRDPLESLIVSKNAAATHNPANILGSLADAAGKGDLFQEYLRTEGSSTFTDVLRKPRNAARQLREQARLTKPAVVKQAQVIKNPREWARKWEDVVRLQEQLSRYQNFRGAYNDAVKRGADRESALLEARWAARNNMVDFYQTGDWSRIANAMFPYFNASVQGGARLARAFKENPVATSAKMIVGIQIPTVLTTMYNLSDPRRAEIYMDMPEYERENNWVFVMPNSEKVDGRWQVVKIPKPAGIGALSRPVEKMTASMYGNDPAQFMDFVRAVVSTGSPFDIGSGSSLVGSLLPQGIKPFVQDAANKDFFTGREIVPSWLSESEPEPFAQHFDSTSSTAKQIAGMLGISPLRIEAFIKSTLGEAGQNALFGLDTATNAVTGQENVGGRSPADSFTRPFTSASGGERQRDLRESFGAALNERTGVSQQITEAVQANDLETANRLAIEFNQRLMNINVSADGELAKLTDTQKKVLDKLKFPLRDGFLTQQSIKSRLKDIEQE